MIVSKPLLFVLVILIQALTLVSQELSIEKTKYYPGETIVVTFTAPDTLPEIAWIGLVPSAVPHGKEEVNDEHQINYKYVLGETKGTRLYRAPKREGSWDIRFNSTDDDGIELHSITFVVDGSDSSEMETTIEEELRIWAIPAVGIGSIRNGELQQISIIGNLKKDRPAPYNAIWNVASLTKPVVNWVVLTLVNTNDWDLDEPLFKYWIDPDVKTNSLHQTLTTRHILSHQSGFDNWRWHSASKKLQFNFEPGQKFMYSGEGFEYLRKALESKFHKSLEELADSLLFTPLGMTDSRFIWDQEMDESRYALAHNRGGAIQETWRREEANAADDLMTTIADYAAFAQNVLKGSGLSPELFEEMCKSQVPIDEHKSYGLGWVVLEDLITNEFALTHSGSDRGVHTMVILLPKSKRGLLVFTNGDHGLKVIEKVVVEELDVGQEIMSRLK